MRCLVIQTAFVGDVILSTPLMRLVRAQPSVTRLGAVVTPDGAQILNGQGIVDEIIEYDKRGGDRGLGGLRRVAARLRRLDVDVALVPHRSFRSALLAVVSGAPARAGFVTSGGRALLTRAFPYDAGAHEVERVARLVEAIGGELPDARLPLALTVTPEGASELDAVLARAGAGASDDILVAAPGSRWATKRWPSERFAESADAVASEFGLGVVLTGEPRDADAARDVGRRASSVIADTTGRLSIPAWIALIARARLLVCNDSAAAHVAAAVGTPVVAVFGPTVPAQGFAPYTDRARVVEADIECRPCGSHGGERCPLNTLACMLDVPAGVVVDRARELLEEGAAP